MAEVTEAQAAVPVLMTKLRRPSTPLLLIARGERDHAPDNYFSGRMIETN